MKTEFEKKMKKNNKDKIFEKKIFKTVSIEQLQKNILKNKYNKIIFIIF